MTDTTGVVGAGLMGIGIALQLARAGHRVHVVDADPQRLPEVAQTAARLLDDLAAAGLHDAGQDDEVQSRIHTGVDVSALAGASWVVEAVPERLSLKQAVYAELEQVLDERAVLASNTSGIMPSQLVEGLRHPERFLVAHFWNPPHAVPLVEVVPSARTSGAAVETTMRLLADIGSRPVLLRKEAPGFVGNRLQYAVLREALAIVQEGIADAEQVDLVMTTSLGRRYATVGPLAGADLGGLDTFREIAALLMPHLAKGEGVLSVLDDLLADGRTGWRSGAGFYAWGPEELRRVRGGRDADLLARLRAEGATADDPGLRDS